MSVFGLLGLFAKNYAPKLPGEHDYQGWFMNVEPIYDVNVPGKWDPKPGGWGIGIGAVLGSAHDLGRTWNGKFGLMVMLPGPVLSVYGAFNFLKQRPNIGDLTSADLIGLIVLDMEDKMFTAGIMFQYSIPEDGKILTIKIPAELLVSTRRPPLQIQNSTSIWANTCR